MEYRNAIEYKLSNTSWHLILKKNVLLSYIDLANIDNNSNHRDIFNFHDIERLFLVKIYEHHNKIEKKNPESKNKHLTSS